MMEHDGCVGCKYEHLPETSDHCQGCTHNAVDKYTRKTNADRIRSMTDEGLAEFISNIYPLCTKCLYDNSGKCRYDEEGEEVGSICNCEKGVLAWLQSEAEG